MFSDLLSRYEADGESFLLRIVNGDETWIHHFEPQIKIQSMEWYHPKSPRKKKFTPLTRKGIATFLGGGDAGEVILVDIMPRGQTIN